MSKYTFASMRYALVLRDGEQKRLAALFTSRSLVDLGGLLKSLFNLHPAATIIDVVLAGWPKSQTLDDQEILVSAERYSGPPPGDYIWYRQRTLRAIEQDIVARAAILADAEPEVRQ